jgi:hypothetical protein
MSGSAPGLRRPGKRAVLVGAAVIAAALVAGLVVHQVAQPQRVPLSDIHPVQGPAKVAANKPVVAAPAGADTSDATDITAKTAEEFAGSLVDARNHATGHTTTNIVAKKDSCLLGWAESNLAALSAKGSFRTVQACGHDAVVLAGPAGSDARVMTFGALEKDAPTGARKILIDSATNRMAYAAVQSVDGKAQLLVASALPEDSSASRNTGNGTGEVAPGTVYAPANPTVSDKAPDGKDIVYTK